LDNRRVEQTCEVAEKEGRWRREVIGESQELMTKNQEPRFLVKIERLFKEYN